MIEEKIQSFNREIDNLKRQNDAIPVQMTSNKIRQLEYQRFLLVRNYVTSEISEGRELAQKMISLIATDNLLATCQKAYSLLNRSGLIFKGALDNAQVNCSARKKSSRFVTHNYIGQIVYSGETTLTTKKRETFFAAFPKLPKILKGSIDESGNVLLEPVSWQTGGSHYYVGSIVFNPFKMNSDKYKEYLRLKSLLQLETERIINRCSQ